MGELKKILENFEVSKIL